MVDGVFLAMGAAARSLVAVQRVLAGAPVAGAGRRSSGMALGLLERAAVIDGAAHAINFSHPDQLANVVRCFLEGRPITADPSAKGGVRVFQTPVES